jgi:hypothetical protein
VWDADLRFAPAPASPGLNADHADAATGAAARGAWQHWSFRGDAWQRVRNAERQAYLKNAYRVLLTRARQGMVVVVPRGDPHDATRRPEWYDGTWAYLRGLGFDELDNAATTVP